MTESVDPATLRAALRQARRQRAQIRAAHPVTSDTAHVVLHPPGEPVLDVVSLRFPESPYLGAPGRPRYRTLAELRRELEAIVARPPLPPKVPEGSSREFVAITFSHQVPGSGAELCIEGLRQPDGGVAWTLYRVPLDGAPTPIASEQPFDDAAFERAFGRPITLAGRWTNVLREAMEGRSAIADVEPGYTIFAAPKGDRSLDKPLLSRVPDSARRRVVRLGAPDRTGLSQLEPGFAQWAPEAAASIRSGVIEVGAVMDVSHARAHIEAALEQRGIEVTEVAATGELLAIDQDAAWPLDPSLLISAAVHLAQSTTETAASFASLVRANLDTLRKFVAAVRAARPQCKIEVERTSAEVTQIGGLRGEPIDLLVAPFATPPGTPGFDATVRFACDPLPSGIDTTHVCRCGAPAHLGLRLVPATGLDRYRDRDAAASPWVVERWPSEGSRWCAVLAVACAAHARFPSRAELEQAGLSENSLARRIVADAALETFSATTTTQADEAGHRLLIAHGINVASIALSDRLLSALDAATGRTLAGRELTVEAVPPDGLCAYERAVDPAFVEAIVARLVDLDGRASAKSSPRSLTWPATIQPIAAGSIRVALTQAPAGGRTQRARPPGPSFRA